MKRTLSLLLSLVLIYTAIPNINLIVDAVNIDFNIRPSAENTTFEPLVPTATETETKNVLDVSVYEFISDVYLDNFHIYKGGSSVTNIKRLIDFYSYNEGFVEAQAYAIQQDKSLMTEINIWEAVTFPADISGSIQSDRGLTTRYEVILLDILKSVLKDSNYLHKLELTVSSQSSAPSYVLETYYACKEADGYTLSESSEEFISTIGYFKDLSGSVNTLLKEGKTYAEISALLDFTTTFKGLTQEQIEKIIDGLKKRSYFENLSIASDALSFTSFGIEQVSDVADVVKTMATYNELTALGQGYIDFLKVLIDNCSDSNIKLAAAKIKASLESSWVLGANQMLNYANKKAADLVEIAWDCCMDAIKNSFPGISIALLAYDVAIDIINFSFGTGEQIEAVYMTLAFSAIYKEIKKSCRICMNRYISNNNEINAELFTASVDILFSAALEDCNIAWKYLDTVVNAGVFTKLVARITGDDEDIEGFKNDITKMESHRKENYNGIKSIAVGLYIELLKKSTVQVETDFDTEEIETIYIPLLQESTHDYIDSGTWGDLEWILYGDYTLVIKGNGSMNDFTTSSTDAWRKHNTNIKAVLIKYGVTSISNCSFYRCTALIKVCIPNSVTTIKTEAFCNNNKLTYVSIPNSVTTIGRSAFSDCPLLSDITLGKKVITIGRFAFSNCHKLTNISIPDSVTTITSSAFSGCSNLKSVKLSKNWNEVSLAYSPFANCKNLTHIDIPVGAKMIPSFAFSGCSSLKSVSIPNTVTIIHTEAFSGCSSLESVSIPNSVTNIGRSSFWNCSKLTSVSIPDSVTTISEYAFRGCSNLKNVKLSKNWDWVGATNGPFAGCKSLTHIDIPNGAKVISLYAFSNCNYIESISIPVSVTSINGHAFSGCTRLATIYYQGFANKWSSISISNNNNELINAKLITKGDLDGDKGLTATDYIIAKDYLKVRTDDSFDLLYSMDVNNDDLITTADLITLKLEIVSQA